MLVGAAALIASLSGHATQLALERARLFGDAPAQYSHSLQSPIATVALAMIVIAAFLIAKGVIESVRDDFDGAEWLVPALDAIRAIDALRLVGVVLCLQIASLVIGELAEQALSSYDAFGLAAIFGPGHLTAPFVHVVMGCGIALLLRAFARAVCFRIDAVAHVARLIIAWIERSAPICRAPELRLLARASETIPPPVLARHLACRPPPVGALLFAWAAKSGTFPPFGRLPDRRELRSDARSLREFRSRLRHCERFVWLCR